MNASIPNGLIVTGRALAIAGVVQAAVYLVLGFDLFEGWIRPLLGIWIAAPLPLAYWFGVKIARTRAAFALVLAAMAIAFAVSVWAYWEITWGETRRTESMSGLLFVFGPLYQYALLSVAALAAWLAGRRARAR
jgi:hypothetical protein